jgi:hypothetical protein
MSGRRIAISEIHLRQSILQHSKLEQRGFLLCQQLSRLSMPCERISVVYRDLGRSSSAFRRDLGRSSSAFRSDLGRSSSVFRSDLGRSSSAFRSESSAFQIGIARVSAVGKYASIPESLPSS